MSLHSRSSETGSTAKGSQALIALPERELQNHLLDGVSRTFALSIPQLPEPLRTVVANAYLLCRIVDTIEDEPMLSFSEKRSFCRQFVDTVSADSNPQALADALAPRLSKHTLPAEHELVLLIPNVIGITHKFSPNQRNVITRCITTMAEGMVEFQAHADLKGLQNQIELDQYCYYVAGVVGEMLTDLFSDYSPAIAAQHERLMPLASSFGQGLQMTNILKDLWEDRSRGVCWLPRDTFEQIGIELEHLEKEMGQEAFSDGLGHLIGNARSHLADALTYSLGIPVEEPGIRQFCLWPVGLAVLTLRRINEHRYFRTGNEVKISRRSVKLTVGAVRLTGAYAPIVRLLFSLAATGLPRECDVSHQSVTRHIES